MMTIISYHKRKTYLLCGTGDYNDMEAGLDVKVFLTGDFGLDDPMITLVEENDIYDIDDIRPELEFDTVGTCVACEKEFPVLVDKHGTVKMTDEAKKHFLVFDR